MLFRSTPHTGAATVGGEAVSLLVRPYIESGRIMGGMRDICTLLGISSNNILWDNDTKTVTLVGTGISLQVGKDYAVVNGEQVALGVDVQLVEGRVVLPIAHIGRLLGKTVEFDSTTKVVTINN